MHKNTINISTITKFKVLTTYPSSHLVFSHIDRSIELFHSIIQGVSVLFIIFIIIIRKY